MNEPVLALVADQGLMPLAGAMLAYFIGGVVKGGIGFGLPLVAIALLPLFVPIDLALASNMVVLFLTNIYQYVRAGRMLETLRRFWPLLVGLAAGVPLGTRAATIVSPETLTAAVGAFIVLFVAFTAINPRIAITRGREPVYSGLTGIVAGTVGAITSTPGPIFASFMLGTGADRRLMLSALGLFLTVLGLLTSGSYWVAGLLDGPRAGFAIACLPAIIAGMWCGNRLAGRLSAERFRWLVMAVLLCLGVYLVIRSI